MARTRKPEGELDRELEDLPAPARRREWMGRVEAAIFAAQMGAPLTAQSIELTALEIRHDRQNRDIARRGSPRCCRYRTLRYQPGLGFRAAHADHAARFVLRLGSRRPPIASVWTTRSG